MNDITMAISSLTVMLLLALPRHKKYNIPIAKVLLLIVYVAIFGFLGTQILYYIENGVWGGISFFGAVLFIPLFLLPAAAFLKIPAFKLHDFVAAPGLAMFIVNKFNCYLTDCCGGKVFKHTPEGIPVYFPSQIVEMSAAAVIIMIALLLERKETLRGKIYPICLLMYGCTRFVLNFYRWDQPDFLFGLAPGNVWALLSVMIGCIWLIKSRNIQYQDL